ncbi:DUF6044 family protein [Aquimarina celericrescens]|uniref:DUF6044 family protein n=1 Tax=Aquimarina celericrescens TaxID=1964542 RepID=A0ABW5ATB5_9FLAO|nr:hypothetical protein [Aquimarina celericrescens]
MTTKLKSIFGKPKWITGLSLVIILLYFLPFLYQGKDSHILVHDNLDSNVTWVKTLLNSGEFFSSPDTKIQNVFNGIPRSSLYGTYDISLIWFKLFGMYYGYIFNKLLMSVIAFFGMCFLLRKIIEPEKDIEFISISVALLFALLPFWSFTMSVCGLPIVLYAFLNIRDGEKHYKNWLIIGIFAFYSSLFLSGVFFILILLCLLVYDIYRNKKINKPFVLAIGTLGILYLISHFQIFYSFLFNSDYTSHRVEMVVRELTFDESYKRAFSMFTKGQYHAHSLHNYILYPVILVGILQFFFKKRSMKYLLILIFILLTSLLYGFLNWKSMASFFTKLMSIIPIQLNRFHFLHPLFWYLLLGLALTFVARQFKFGKLIVVPILIFQLYFVLKHHEFITQKNGPAYNKFYSEELFEEAKKFIGKPQKSYRVISLGLHPSIALYNGFYTLDGYFPDYPLEHKHNFRKVIAKELDKNKKLQKYYDNWGSRCYAFSSQLARKYWDTKPRKVKKLEFDFKALKALGGEYIFSSAEIDTKNTKGIKLLKVFEHPNSQWKIHLYQIVIN